MGLMSGKTALIFGVANDHSIAWGIAQALAREGATLGFSYAGEALAKRVRPLAASVNSTFDACNAGTSPNTIPVTADINSVKLKTQRSMLISDNRGTFSGIRRINTSVPHQASSNPRTPPAKLSTRLSVSN